MEVSQNLITYNFMIIYTTAQAMSHKIISVISNDISLDTHVNPSNLDFFPRHALLDCIARDPWDDML